ncbi:DNA replication complex GINS protein PSF1 [Mycena galopus ATCC 62051]|nr:DNA replication complex GINS protein PSF1 [Mycena galopus ATCC 62051]
MSFDDTYGTLAHDLVLRAKLSMGLAELLPYDCPLVRRILQEQHDLNSKIGVMEVDGVTASTHERWPALVILARVVHQNKRCLLAYHSHRLGAIRTAYWQAGAAIAHVLTTHEAKTSSDEVQYLYGFHDSVVQYRAALSGTDILDLNMGLEDPPRESVFITVETVVEPGPIYIESGLVDFKLGQRYVLVKEHIEHLLLQGYLRQV